MHKETVKPDVILFIKNNKVILIIVSLVALAISATAISNHGLPFSTSDVITYQDPNDSKNYIIMNTQDHTFEVHQGNSPIYTGSYVEYPDCYSLKYDYGFADVAQKVEGGLKSPKGNVWKKV